MTGDHDANALRRRLVATLVERGELTAQWRPAMEHVARHEFVPDTVWRQDPDLDGRDLVPVHRADDPAAWMVAAYADAAVFTQVDDGNVHPDGRGREVTSSASQPAIVAQMLAALDVEPGMRVLEIGTGTGWNAGLLAYRLGAGNVVSVEIDPVVADRTRARLTRTGYGAVTVVTGDGAAGVVDRGPFDRVIATASARRVPPAWVAQTRPSGLVLIPWSSSDWYPSALLRIDVGPDGDGRGRIVGDASFMGLRDQRRPRSYVSAVFERRENVTTTTTDVHPWYVGTEPNAATAIGLRLPDVKNLYADDAPRGPRVNLLDAAGTSWARVMLTDTTPYPVEQSGPRRLWDEVMAAYQWWREQGEPARDRWRVVVEPGGQQIDLTPSSSVAPTSVQHCGPGQEAADRAPARIAQSQKLNSTSPAVPGRQYPI